MAEYKISLEEIERFLNGHDDEKYIVNVEYDAETNLIHKVKQDPERGNYIETEPLLAFMWIKNLNKIKELTNFYGNSDSKIKSARQRYGIEIKSLGGDHPKLIEGYKYLVTCNQGQKRMLEFFREGGIFVYDKRHDINTHFLMISPVEQYFIHTGKRLFKGFEEYDDIHKFIFDLETTGLDPHINRIFLIGVYTNKGVKEIIPVEDDDESERQAITKFFEVINNIKPTIIAGYNSANFDWDFFFVRCQKLGLNIQDVAITLKPGELIQRKEKSVLKLGNEVEEYTQTNMFGYSVIDIIHSARRAQAIDSSMKSVGLKYVCKYNKIAKKNRVYIIGDKIGNTWYSKDKFYFDDRTGSYSKTKPALEFMDYIRREDVQANPDKVFVFGDNVLRQGLGGQAKEMRGEPNVIGIVTKHSPESNPESYFNDKDFDKLKKYIDSDVNQIIEKIKQGKTIVFPKMGIGTGLAQLDMRAPKTFKYLVGLLRALRDYINTFEEVDGKYIVERYLVDDLWETMEVDGVYNQSSFLLAKLVPTTYQRVSTMGTAGLWKLLMMAYSFENDLAIPVSDTKRDYTGGLSRLFKVGYSTTLRKMDYNSLYPAIQLAHDVFPSVDVNGAMKSMLKYFHTERFKAKKLSDKYKKEGNYQLADKYKRKQLPLKIFINSLFGALGAPTAFQWAEIDVSERITCTARQYLRLMVTYFIKRGYTPLVLDTDGVNFMAPKNGEHYTYVGKGLNDEVEAGKEYTGVKAVVAEFNDTYMRGEMGLGLDGIWPATINLSRKNYALLEDDGSISLTGNSIKSKAIPVYIEEFLGKGMKMLLNGHGYDFVQYYYEYAEKVYNKKIPLAKIATKSRVKKSINAYINRGGDKNGRQLAKQAHMELAIKHNIDVNLGDTIYYVNNGKTKSHGDAQEDKNGEMYATLVPNDIIENQPDYIGEYNVPKYLETLNKKVEPLLVAFPLEVRDKILIKKAGERTMFLRSELDLVNNQPTDIEDQDTLEEFFTPSPMEKDFWAKMKYESDYWFSDEIRFKIPGLDEEFTV